MRPSSGLSKQTARADAIKFYRQRQKKLSTDILSTVGYAHGRALKHGLSSSSKNGIAYFTAFNSTIEQLRMDAMNEETAPEKIKQPVRDSVFTSIISLNEFTSDMDKTLDNMGGIFLMSLLAYIVFSIPIYFLPWIISMFSKHPTKGKIFLLNFFLGWTFVGWIIALVWACTKPQPPLQVIINQPLTKETSSPPTPD